MTKRILESSQNVSRTRQIEAIQLESEQQTAYLLITRMLGMIMDEETLALVKSKAIQLDIHVVNEMMPFLFSSDPASWNEAALEMGGDVSGVVSTLGHAREVFATVLEVLGMSVVQKREWSTELPHNALLDLRDNVDWLCLPLMLIVIGSASTGGDLEGVDMLKRIYGSGDMLDNVRHYAFSGVRLIDAAIQSYEEAVDRRGSIG
jgi:hypothetical protein